MYSNNNCTWLLAVVLLSDILCTPILIITNRNEKRSDNEKLNNINQDTLEFMQKFGYLDQTAGPQAMSTGDTLVAAIKLVQEFGGLEQTGKLDNATLKLVKSKRCGVPDVTRKQNNSKSKRFVLSKGWNKRFLTYYITNFTPKLSRERIKYEIQRAFSKWSQYSQLNFLEADDGRADIMISFSVSDHGDPFPFDGKGNVLAHAFYPTDQGSLGGDIHFDEVEDWTLDNTNNNYGINFYSVAIHEMGHSLGLGHSSEANSIMNPYYKSSEPQELGYDDILGMYSLYVSRKLPDDNLQYSTTTKKPQSNVPNTPHVHWSSFDHEPCTEDETITPDYFTTYKPEVTTLMNYNRVECSGNYDAVSCFRGEMFVFKGNLLWRLNKPGSIMPRYPVHLTRFFQVLADSDHKIDRIDAAYERPDANIVMFHENKYYVFNGNHLIENSPRTIMNYGFPPFVSKVDAVMVHGEPPLTYLFSGEYFWIYDDRRKTLLQRHRSIREHFKGLRPPIDDVLTWKEGDTYFFSGNQYWKFDYNHNKTENGYPKIAAEFLFGCSS